MCRCGWAEGRWQRIKMQPNTGHFWSNCCSESWLINELPGCFNLLDLGYWQTMRRKANLRWVLIRMHGEMRENFPTTFTVKFLIVFFLEESGKQVIYCVPVLVCLVSVIWDNFSQLWNIRNVGVTSQPFWEEKEDKDIIIKVQACKPSWILLIHLSSFTGMTGRTQQELRKALEGNWGIGTKPVELWGDFRETGGSHRKSWNATF